MQIRSLTLLDFRSYSSVEMEFAPGLTALLGANGTGKTNILEAIGIVAGIGSLCGSPTEALLRTGSETAVVRCQLTTGDGRDLLIAAELARAGRSRFLINGQRLTSRRELLEGLVVTVFSPDDLGLVKGGPDGRRRWLDDVLVSGHPKHAAQQAELDRALRQRNSVLRSAAGRASREIELTLDVWDEKLAAAGDALRQARLALLASLTPRIAAAYQAVAASEAAVGARYASSWGDESLAAALVAARPDDLRRRASTVGPHRDDIVLSISGLATRTQASQGEQRCLALALRLAADAEVRAQRGLRPVLLLDDVFSELDSERSRALLENLPPGQCILSSANDIPATLRADRVLQINAGSVELARG